MSYRLVLSEKVNGITRDVGENVFFDNLSSDYKVYLFYYPGSMPNEELEYSLRNLGKITGRNLFVNIGKLNDPSYEKFRNKFQIRNLPTIIITAVDQLASIETVNNYLSSYVKIDQKELLDSVKPTIECVEKVFDLFMGGEISDAMREAKNSQHDAIIINIKNKISNALHQIGRFLSDRDIVISFFEGKFELKKSIK